MPVLMSMLGDIFTDKYRARAMAGLGILHGGGVLIGQMIAGMTAPSLGWRAPYALIGTPGIVATIGFAIFARAPPRGGAERALIEMVEKNLQQQTKKSNELSSRTASWRERSHRRLAFVRQASSFISSVSTPPTPKQSEAAVASDEPPVLATVAASNKVAPTTTTAAPSVEFYADRLITKEKFYALLRTKTLWIITLSSVVGSLPWAFLVIYGQDFIVTDIGPRIAGGISVRQSTAVLVIFAIGGAFGTVLGGFIADALYVRDMRLVPLFCAATVALGATPMIIFINIVVPLYAIMMLAFTGGFFVALGGVGKNALLLDCTLPETRGSAFALNTLLDDTARGLASYVISIMVVALNGRFTAMNIALGGWYLGSLLLAFAAFTIRGDVHRCELALQIAADEDAAKREEEKRAAVEEAQPVVAVAVMGEDADKPKDTYRVHPQEEASVVLL